MKACLVLVLVLLTGDALGKFPGFSFKSSDDKDDSFDDLHKHLSILSSGVDHALHLALFMTDQQSEFSNSLENIWKNQDILEAQSSKAVEVVSAVLQDTEDILDKQKQLFKGQSFARELIVKEQTLTREAVADLEKTLGSLIGKVAANQKAILNKIDQGRSKAISFFAQFLQVKAQTESQVQNILKAVVSTQEANSRGQSNILEVVFGLRKAVAERLSSLRKNQGVIVKSLESSQKNVENSIDKVIAQQGIIFEAVEVRREAELSDLEELKTEQVKTQEKVSASASAILRDISDIRGHEAGTQHILHKCKDSHCDPSKTLHLIKHILQQVEEYEAVYTEDILGILSAEAKTFSEVDELENNVLQSFSSNVDGTVLGLNAVGNSLATFLDDTEGTLKSFRKEVQFIENAQESIEHKLKKIFDKLKDLHFPKHAQKKDHVHFGKKKDDVHFGKKKDDFHFGKKNDDFHFGKKNDDFHFGKKNDDFHFGKKNDFQFGKKKNDFNFVKKNDFQFGKKKNDFNFVKKSDFQFGKKNDFQFGKKKTDFNFGKKSNFQFGKKNKKVNFH